MKGAVPVIAVMGAIVLGIFLSIVVLIIFKVDIETSIIYEHKANTIGYGYNTILSLKTHKYTNTESLGSYILINSKSSTPEPIKNFDNSFKTRSDEIFPSQDCVSLIIRNNDDLKIDNSFVFNSNYNGEIKGKDDSCVGGSLIQSTFPIALPYNKDEIVKIVSMVTNK